MKLDLDFYRRTDVVMIARELLGKVLVTRFHQKRCMGIITETEAYAGETDRASHAYGGRRTERTEIMYAGGGVAYVYLIYGIHSLFNVVTNETGVPHAVLIRAIRPIDGIKFMETRRNKPISTKGFCSGPGTLSQAMGIHYSHSGISLSGDKIFIEDNGIIVKDQQIITGPRIGVDYAGADAHRPYRFRLDSNFTF